MSHNRLKTAFVIDDLGFGGAQRQLSILVEALARTAEPCVFCMSENARPYGERIRRAGVEVIVLPRSRGFDLLRARDLARAIEGMNIDIVHGFLDAANVYAWVAARRAGRPCVLSLRNERLRLGGLRRWALRLALRRADSVVANSKAGRRFLIDVLSLPRERVTVIPNAVSFSSMPPPLPAPEPPVIGFVGRLDLQKQVGVLVDAFALAAKELPDATLVIVGDGPERASLLDRVRGRGVADRVQFTGLVENAERMMAGFSCLVLPSAYEGFPNVALEAVALGVPVVAAAVGDVEDIVIDDRTGYLWRDPSVHTLAGLLLRAAKNDELRRRTGQEGPALVRENYSVDVALARLMPVYERIVNR
jgi:glycosyltransferase involved in cell wall biosynthesis